MRAKNTLYLTFFRKFFVVILLFAAACATVIAQSEGAPSIKAEIQTIKVMVSGEFSVSEISAELATKETPASVLIFLNENISQNLGAPRSYFDPFLFYNDIVHLYNFLHDRGYFNAKIDTALSFSEDLKNIAITVSIEPGKRSFIDTILYKGLGMIEPELYKSIMQSSIKIGEPFRKARLVEEQNRIISFLHSNGYPLATMDSVSIKRYASTNNISVIMSFNTGKKLKFGEVVYPHMDDDAKISEEVIARQLDFQPGEIYSEEKRVSSEQNLNRLGIFENAGIRPLFFADSTGAGAVPMLLSYRMLELQEVTPEFLVVSENNELFSTGVGLGYRHRNLFGGAQNFSLSASGRINKVEQYFNYYVLRSAQQPVLYSKANMQLQLIFPYFFSNKTNASITLTGEFEQQESYDLNTLRTKLSFTTKFAHYTLGTTDFNIERVDPKFDNPQSLRVEDTTKQFNFIEAFTLQRNKTNNFFSPSEGFFHSATIEEAGLVSKAAGGFGLPYSEYVKISFLVKHYFSEENNAINVLALKLQGGIAIQYNSSNPTPVPLPRRFFMGGSGSVRAWRDKQLAAFGDTLKGGTIAFEGSIENRVQLFPNGGRFLFLNMENIWTVFFLDYGNTWNKTHDVTLKQVALAVGFGFRYETFVGPFRFDIAWRLYDPKAAQGRQWLYEQSFFNNSFSIVHFGIGHAF